MKVINVMAMHTVGVGKLADAGLHQEIASWLHREAELLDAYREREWLDQMVSEDIVYQVPLRHTVERARGPGFVAGTFHLDERYGSLRSKVARNETGLAWAEDPPSRIRHYVSNVRVGEPQDGCCRVHSNCLIFRTRSDRTEPNIFSCERQDLLTRQDGGWRLRERVIYLDHTNIASHNLAIFF